LTFSPGAGSPYTSTDKTNKNKAKQREINRTNANEGKQVTIKQIK